MLRIPHRLRPALAAAALSFAVVCPAQAEPEREPHSPAPAELAPAASLTAPAPLPAPAPGLRPRAPENPWLERADRAARGVLARVPARWRPWLDPLLAFASDPIGRRVGAGLVGGLLVLIVLLRLARRPGDLIVLLDYPAELRGTFSVRIATNKADIRRRPAGERARWLDAASTRSEHHLVARETQFRGFPPGRYWIGIEGLLEDPGTRVLVDECFEVHPATVLPRRSNRLSVDLRPKRCAVLVKLRWNRQSVSEGAVAVRGLPESLRYTRQGVARIDLPLGTYHVLAGSADRVGEAELRLDTYRAASLEIDLGESAPLVFRGCPPAVAPYLRGDLSGAMHALRRDGQDEVARRLDARAHERDGQIDRAAELYEEAGDSNNAVRLLLEVKPEHSGYVTACERLADSFERAGELEMAVARVEEAIRHSDRERMAPLYLRWSGLLERLDDPDGARTVLLKLSEIEPANAELAARMEQLDKRQGGEQTSVLPVAGAAAELPMQGGRYQLIERIGTGGMGVVFRALDRRLGREIALKRLPEAMADNPTAVELFLREARAAASLNHPNIVTLFDADEEDGRYFITMELLTGATLNALKRRRGRFDGGDVARVGRQVCDGLEYAHQRRVVHRDVKPANLFLTHDGSVKIMDFGLAKTMQEVRRAGSVIGGTPFYMAPEQAKGSTVGPAADLYALGVTFFELVTGGLPFEGDEVARDHMYTPPPDPRSIVAGIPDALAALILQLLAKDPAQRPESAAAVAGELVRIASDADAASTARRLAGLTAG